MSGAKRASRYRKGVVARTVSLLPTPEAEEKIVRVVSMRGGNLVEVVDATTESGLAILPAKFRRLIWIKRGDYLIVSSGDADQVKYIVRYVLYPRQIAHLKAENLWPFEEEAEGPPNNDSHTDDLFIVNTNHLRRRQADETDESDDDDDRDDH